MTKEAFVSKDAEMSVLGCCLQSPKALADVMEVLHPSQFWTPAHQVIYKAILDVVERSGVDAVDNATVFQRLNETGQITHAGGRSYLFDLETEAPSLSNAKTYAATVELQAQRRRAIQVSKAVIDIASDTDISEPNEIVDRAVEQFNDLRVERGDDGFAVAKATLKTIDDEIVQAMNGEVTRKTIPTQFAGLTKRIGGYEPGEFYAVGGATSMGKTSFAKTEAINLAKQGIPVLYVSCEVTDKQLLRGILASMARVPIRMYRGEEPMNEEMYQRHAEACEELYTLPLFILSGGKKSFSRVVSKAEFIKREKGQYPTIILDYVQALVPKRKGMSFTESIDEAIGEYKEFALRAQVPIIALCQLSRDVSKPDPKGIIRRPAMYDLADSKAIENWASAVILLFREEYYLARKDGREEHRTSQAELLVLKNRYGAMGKELCIWDSWRAMYSEVGA
jgi:replicative DNA helicase